MGTAAPRHFEIYGLRVRVAADWPEVVESVRLDFAWFERRDAVGQPDAEVIVERRPPDLSRFGPAPATFVTPRNVVYDLGSQTIVDYFGRAVLVLDRESGRALIQSEEEHLVHEAAYQFLTSRVGEHLDARGLTRVHGLGLAGRDGAVVVMLPSGGGKSTLALRALADDARLISDDTPLVDRRGMVHPYVVRIGVNATDADSLPRDRVRRIERMEFHPKLALEVEAFADRIQRDPLPLRHLVVGRRTLAHEPQLEQLPRRHAGGALLREAVVGVGVYQGMEFVLQRGMGDVLAKAGTVASRSLCCAAALRGARVWRLSLGRDPRSNWEALSRLLAW